MSSGKPFQKTKEPSCSDEQEGSWFGCVSLCGEGDAASVASRTGPSTIALREVFTVILALPLAACQFFPQEEKVGFSLQSLDLFLPLRLVGQSHSQVIPLPTGSTSNLFSLHNIIPYTKHLHADTEIVQ